MEEHATRAGKAIDETWTAAGRTRAAFAGIAAEKLRDMPAWRFDPAETMAFVARRAGLPHRVHDVFSDAPVVLYDAGGVALELLVWTRTAPGIHGHALEGAFRVLEGSSVHAVYRFEETARVSDEVRAGKVVQKRLEVLRAGDTREIPADAMRLHHQTLHAERPSVTLVAHDEPATRPHYILYPPGLAVEVPTRTGDRRLPALERLIRYAGAERPDTAAEFFRTAAFDLGSTGFVRTALRFPTAIAWVLQTDHDGSWRTRLDELLGPAGGQALIDAHERGWRRAQWLALHAAEPEPAGRFTLALLVMAERGEDALAAIAKRYEPKDPTAWLSMQIVRIANTGTGRADNGGALCRRLQTALRPAPDRERAIEHFITGTDTGDAPEYAGALEKLAALPELENIRTREPDQG